MKRKRNGSGVHECVYVYKSNDYVCFRQPETVISDPDCEANDGWFEPARGIYVYIYI